jgi:hypothetical protein
MLVQVLVQYWSMRYRLYKVSTGSRRLDHALPDAVQGYYRLLKVRASASMLVQARQC